MLARLNISKVQPKSATQIPEPPIAKFLFADTRVAWVWLIVRVYVGWQWLAAGVEKMTGHNIDLGHWGDKPTTPWVFNSSAGAAMKGFAQGALAGASGSHPSVQGWYANFLKSFVIPNPGFWAFLITFGEVAVGLGLIVGALTGVAAFFGVVMNFNYLLAGTVSINPILGFLGILLILAWRVAGYYGVDRYLLPVLGTPWTGSLTTDAKPEKSSTEMPTTTNRPLTHAMS